MSGDIENKSLIKKLTRAIEIARETKRQVASVRGTKSRHKSNRMMLYPEMHHIAYHLVPPRILCMSIANESVIPEM